MSKEKRHDMPQVNYDVFRDEEYGFWRCDCPDFILRDKEHKGQECKHVRSLREAGLIP